ncbi:AAA family ATPase [Exiguobacterium aurantiacum]|uniref:Nuclease SbcCD subunit C n=1 Tax=Exiguobacterium aurantiacum TaxID=33987 RepID=A0A377FWR1_9BACL|nr:AAA family ATPase [Exiguobacterium aurantiacum]STO09269.1 recombination protein F [Exiguobacterium aurantiacum]
MSKYRLKEMEIEGFRIYSKNKKVKFFNNITVVYGRNGRGKTTLQDALGWLFNNDITRYAEYNREWSRVKGSHIRSLLQPDISTAITARLEDVETFKVDTITRTEEDLKYSNLDFDKWFESAKRGDVLWANSLTQAKLQELAVAKGRDRLEILAPLLDLTEINLAIKKVEENLRKEKEILKRKHTSLTNISDREGREEYEILNEVSNIGEKISERMLQLIEVPHYPTNNTNKVQEIKEWETWCNSVLNIVSADQSLIENKINAIREKYFQIEEDTSSMEDEKLEEMEKRIAEEVLKIESKKDRIKELKNKIIFIKNNIVIVDESIQKISELNISQKNIDKDISNYEANKENQLDESMKIKEMEMQISKLKIQKDEIENYHEILLLNKQEIEEYHKKFTLTIKEINENKKELVEHENWLMKNTQTKNNENIKLLEDRLANIGDNIEELVNQNIELDKSFDILCGYISDESCPLCGKKHESISELEVTILHQKKRWENVFITHKKEIKEISNKLSEIRASNITKENTERAIKEIQRKISNAEINLLKVKGSFADFLKKIGVKISLCDFEDKDFKKMLEKNSNEILKLIDKKSEINGELNKLEIETKKLKNIIEVNQKKHYKCIAESNQINREISKEIEGLKSIYNSFDSSENFDTTEKLLLLLKNQIPLLERELENIDYKTDMIKVEKIEKEIFFKYKKRIEIISNTVMEIKKLLGYLDVLRENLKIVDTSSELKKEIKELEMNIEGLKKDKRNLREVQRKETNKEIGKISKRISKIFEILSDVSPWRTILPDAVVPDERERTNLVFRPVPQKLDSSIEEYLLKTNSNSTFAFSGGQLSLLGLSIFLSQVADKEKKNFGSPTFETLFLDDPIQMLDTLRDDALVSLICDIARERQVVISTSDIDFANKLILSSRPLWKDDEKSCGVIYYEQLYEDGPVISEINSKDWIESQRIYIPKIKEAK